MSLDNLIRRADFIDKVDAITGPFSALCYQSGSEFLISVGSVINVAELALKIPFAISYAFQTGDKMALLYWGVKEIVANTNPTIGYIDIVPFYSMRARYILGDFK